MTLQFSVVFFLTGQFLFKCWELPHSKQLRQILEMCPSCRHALYFKSCLLFLIEVSSLRKDLSLWLGPGVGERRLSLNPRLCCCHLSRTSVVIPRSPRTASFRQLIPTVFTLMIHSCFSSTENWFNSLVTTSSKSFV